MTGSPITARSETQSPQTYPDIFHDFNERLWEPGGFHRPVAARKREWKTKTGKANFIPPTSLSTDIDIPQDQRDVVQLMTLRSNGQFNTTVYSYDDRFRGIYGSRHVVLMHQNDIDRFDLKEGQMISLTTAVDDGVERSVTGLQIVAYDIPRGMHRRLLPGMQPTDPALASREKGQGARRQVDTGQDTAARPVAHLGLIEPSPENRPYDLRSWTQPFRAFLKRRCGRPRRLPPARCR